MSIVSFTYMYKQLNVEVFLISSVNEAMKYWHNNIFFLPGNLDYNINMYLGLLELLNKCRCSTQHHQLNELFIK